MTKAPTDRQLALHAWMLAYQFEHSMPPTMRELAKAFGFKSTHSAVCHMQAMEKKGMVTHRPGVSRGWVAIAAQATEAA